MYLVCACIIICPHASNACNNYKITLSNNPKFTGILKRDPIRLPALYCMLFKEA